jgi:hypothetical protein|tara:strand:+ start:1146 stop:1700 length:555 start_codon:yes stop_codon:yes gene_type:complete
MADYELLGVTTASSSPTTLTVSSIPQTHDDLEIVCLLMGEAGNYGSEAKFRLNGITDSYYNRNWIRGVNNSVYFGANVTGDNGIAVSQGIGAGDTSTNYNAAISLVYIPNYTLASGASPDPGYMTGMLQSYQLTNAGTWEIGIYSWSMTNSGAAADPVTSFGVSGNSLADNSMIAVYGINRSSS